MAISIVASQIAALVALAGGSGSGGPSRLYVNGALPNPGNGQSWATAYNSLETALAVARTPGTPVQEIWVTRGTYVPSRITIPGDVRSRTFELPGAVQVHGGFAGDEANFTPSWLRAHTPSILSGDLLGDDDDTFTNYFNNAYNVCLFVGGYNGTQSSTLTGIDIRGGNADGAQAERESGGGVAVKAGTLRFFDGRIYRNLANREGGGIDAYNANLQVVNAQIFNNHSSDGGGVSLGSTSVVTGLPFSASFTNTAISDCTAFFLVQGASSLGGGIRNIGHALTISNCTIAQNNALIGGGVYSDNGPLGVANAILWGNIHKGGSGESAQIFVESAPFFSLTYSCVQGFQGPQGLRGPEGETNIGDDPRFRGPSLSGADYAGDFHIAVDSPGIDAGNNAIDTDILAPGVQPLDPTGIFGIPRFADGDHANGVTVDMGFTEVQYFENVYWRGDGGSGSLTDPFSWYGGALPRDFDPIAFDLNEEYTVFVESPFTAGLLSVRVGDATFQLGADLTFTYPTTSFFDPSIAVDGDGVLRFEGLPRGKQPEVTADVVSIGLNGPGFMSVEFPVELNANQVWVGAGSNPEDEGALDVKNGGEVNVRDILAIGRAYGEMSVTDGSSVYVAGNDFDEGVIIGAGGTGSLSVSGESSFDTGGAWQFTLAKGAGSSADVEVGSGGSGMNINAGLITIGLDGAGQMRATQGGDLDFQASSAITLGENPGAAGDVRAIDGAVSFSASQVDIGASGHGVLVVSGEEPTEFTINATDRVVFGFHPGSTYFVEIGSISPGGDDDALLEISADDITLGKGGAGTIVLRFDHPTLSTNAINGVRIAEEPGSSLALRLYSGATWNDFSPVPIRFGVGGSASLLMDPGAVINAESGIEIGPGSSIVGQSTITGDVLNTGILDPAVDGAGLPWGGRLTIEGDYTQLRLAGAAAAESGALIIRQGGSGENAHTGVVVNGTANLAGGLFVRLDSGFSPSASSEFDMNVLKAEAINGAFDVAYFPGFPDTRFMRLSYRQGVPLADGSFGVAAVVTTDILESGVQFPGPQTFPAPGEPNWAALGDVDGDLDLDLAITIPDSDPGMPGSVAVLFNAGVDGMGDWLGFSGSQQFACGREPAAIAAADMEGDDDTDLVVVNTGDDTISVYINDGLGNFTRTDYSTGGDQPVALAIADFSPGSGLDVAVVHRGSRDLVLLANDGLRSLNPRVPQPMSQGLEPTAVGGGGMDEDKDIDVSVGAVAMNADGTANGAGFVSVIRNIGTTPLAPMDFETGDGPKSIIVADLNLDGVDDVATADTGSNTVSILLNAGTGGQLNPAVSLQVGDNPPSLSYADIDGDSDPDLAVVATQDTEGSGSVVQVLRNNLFNNQLAFAPAATLFEGTQPKFVLTGDVDNDSDPDIITLNNGTVFVSGRGFEPIAVELTSLFLAGDANLDGVVDMLDLNIVLSEWQQTGNVQGDVNHDGIVDFSDLNIVLAYYGTSR